MEGWKRDLLKRRLNSTVEELNKEEGNILNHADGLIIFVRDRHPEWGIIYRQIHFDFTNKEFNRKLIADMYSAISEEKEKLRRMGT